MKREEIQLPKHRVILMQEILQTIAVEEKNPIGFEAALRQAKVSYRPWMRITPNMMFLICTSYLRVVYKIRRADEG